MTGRYQAGSRALLALLLAFELCACAGGVDTPEPDPIGGSGGAASTGGRAGRGGSGGVASAGTGGRASEPGDAGAGGSGESGGSGSSEPDAGGVITPQPPREYCNAVRDVFQPTCGNGSCHTNRGATIGDFGAGEAEAASYVGRGSVRDPDCGLIIDPVNPQESLILTKVIGGYPTDQNCGGRMPVGSFEITDEQIDCISDWVEQFRR